MYKIGMFSKKTNTSIKTLRYYDEINLFKPEYCDPFTGYRYYKDEQIDTMFLINKLKKINLSLSEIKSYLETKDINVTFPEDYHAENLKGAKVVFKVTLHDVKERNVPKLNKDFFEDLGIEGVDSKEKLEETVEKEIKERKEHEAEDKYLDELLKKASNNIEAEIEDEIYEAEIDRIYNQFIERMKMQGIDEDMYFKYTNSSKTVLREQMKEEAQTRVKERYLLMAIAKEQKFEVTMKDAEARVKEMAESYKVSENEIIEAFGGIENIKFDIEMKKAIEYLKECNK